MEYKSNGHQFFLTVYINYLVIFVWLVSGEKKNSVSQMQMNDPLPSHTSIKPLNVSPPEQCP